MRSTRAATNQRGVSVCWPCTYQPDATACPVVVSIESRTHSPPIFVKRNDSSASTVAMVAIRSESLTGVSSARRHAPRVTDPPTRRPTNGVTPPPTTTLVKRGGLLLPKVRRARIGDVSMTAARTSQCVAETVVLTPSGYTAPSRVTRGLSGSGAGSPWNSDDGCATVGLRCGRSVRLARPTGEVMSPPSTRTPTAPLRS